MIYFVQCLGKYNTRIAERAKEERERESKARKLSKPRRRRRR